MIWANQNNQRVEATPKQKAICPSCNQEVISKCGSIKIWHWSHKSNFECDSFKEPETEWHFNWKKMFPKENQEVVMQGNQGLENHRADIRTKEGTIIELQNSPISPEKIKERENFYKNMIWILNGKTIAKNLYLKEWKNHYIWLYFPQSWSNVSSAVYIDLGNQFLYLIYGMPTKYGEGRLISKDAFIVLHGGKPWNN